MEIEFNIIGIELVMSYSPFMGTESIAARFNEDEGYNIKRTFYVTKELLRSNFDDSEETFILYRTS